MDDRAKLQNHYEQDAQSSLDPTPWSEKWKKDGDWLPRQWSKRSRWRNWSWRVGTPSLQNSSFHLLSRHSSGMASLRQTCKTRRWRRRRRWGHWRCPHWQNHDGPQRFKFLLPAVLYKSQLWSFRCFLISHFVDNILDMHVESLLW